VSNLDRTIGLAGCEDESCASDLGGEAMRGCGIPRGFWLKPGGSADRVDGIIVETLSYCANINFYFIETLLYCANIIRKYTRPCGTHCNKQTNNIKLILINNEQYLLSGTENQYIMDKFVITGTTITEPVVTVPWSSLYELIKQANANPKNHEKEANMEWTYGLTLGDGYPSWEKNRSQTNGVWNMEKLMTEINANLPKSEPRYTIATVNETVTHNTPKHESVVQPTNKVAQQTFTPEVTAKEISPETYKAKGRGTRPNMFKMTDEELKKCAGGNTGEMPLLRNQQASTSQHASNYYSNELEIIHTSLIEQHKTQNEKIARNASNKIREILTKEGPVSTLPTIPGNIQTSQIQMESIRVENIQLPENEQEQEDIEMLESEPTNVCLFVCFHASRRDA
jgi:hypothetical protein